MRIYGKSEKDSVYTLSLENHQLQQICYKYKNENIDLKKRIED